MAFPLRCIRSEEQSPMLKIQRSSNGEVVFGLTGRIEIEDIGELQRLFTLEEVGFPLTLDLENVTLVDREAVSFLAKCEADGVKLENCPAYIRVWIDRDKSRE
jgi:hypothetical protein